MSIHVIQKQSALWVICQG